MEEETNINTEETLVEGEGVTPSDGGTADNDFNQESSDALTLEELNSYLGKNFKTKESALKSFKDTFSYVGKRKEEIAGEVVKGSNIEDVNRQLQELRDENWFAKNNQFELYKETILAMRKDGQSLNEVVESLAFKGIYERAKSYDEAESQKSVLHSNPKLGLIKSKTEKASQYLAEYNKAKLSGDSLAAEKNLQQATKAAVDSVLDLL
jgi:hypothetical protein